MKTYLVGGAVSDKLLGIPIKDRDWVVTGATPEEMIKEGFKAVGEDFPVFLHPQTKEEYALARTERKSGKGYKGFTFYSSPEIMLEEDLKRRDITINAIAEDENGNLIDPYDGKTDLKNGDSRGDEEVWATGGLSAVAGYPHITIPLDLVNGFPVGVSFLASAWEEAKLINMAYSFEDQNSFYPRPKNTN